MEGILNKLPRLIGSYHLRIGRNPDTWYIFYELKVSTKNNLFNVSILDSIGFIESRTLEKCVEKVLEIIESDNSVKGLVKY